MVWGKSKDLCFVLQSLYIEFPVFPELQFFILACPTPQCHMACIYFENETYFNFVSRIPAYSCPSLETTDRMAPSPRFQVSLHNIHQPSFNPGSMELPAYIASVFPIGTAHLALTQSGLNLLLRVGRGPRQASSSFMSWVLPATSKL